MINEKLNKDILELIDENSSKINNLKPKILCINPNQSSSSFSAQNVSLNTDDYDYYEIIYMFSTTNTNCGSTGKILKGKGTMLVFIINTGEIHGNTTRNVNYNNATQLGFESTITEAGGTSNNRCIPLYIIGYKF